VDADAPRVVITRDLETRIGLALLAVGRDPSGVSADVKSREWPGSTIVMRVALAGTSANGGKAKCNGGGKNERVEFHLICPEKRNAII
jgi:hypothetical protein